MFVGFLFPLHYLFFVWRDLVCGSSWRTSWLWLTLSIKPVEGVLVHGSEIVLDLIGSSSGRLQLQVGSCRVVLAACVEAAQVFLARECSHEVQMRPAASWQQQSLGQPKVTFLLWSHIKRSLSCSTWWWESCCMYRCRVESGGRILMLASKVWENLKA